MGQTMNDNMLKPLDWPPIKVDVRVPDDALSAMLAHVEATFQHLEKVDPNESGALRDTYRAAFITQRDDAFYESGKIPVRQLIATLARYDIAPERLASCFELGCGLGRSTIWLAEHFDQVTAADISAPHLRMTQEAVTRFGRQNVAFLHTNKIDSLTRVPRFDALFSIVVLQHNPPPVIRYVLDVLLSRLNSGGVAYFQVPTYRFGYSFDAQEFLAAGPNLRSPPMHVLPQPDSLPCLKSEAAGCSRSGKTVRRAARTSRRACLHKSADRTGGPCDLLRRSRGPWEGHQPDGPRARNAAERDLR